MAKIAMTTSSSSTRPGPHETVTALVAEHGIQIEEWDGAALDADLFAQFGAMYVRTQTERYIVVPVGQDPAQRLAAVRALLAHPGVAV